MPILGTIASSQTSVTPGMFFINSTTLGSNQNGVTLNDFGGYDDLVIHYLARASVDTSDTEIVVNNTTGSNYPIKLHYSTSTGFNGESFNTTNSWPRTGYSAYNSSEANFYGTNQIYLPRYTSNSYKTIIWYGAGRYGSDIQDATGLGLWQNTASITSLVMNGTWATGTQFWVYGIKKS